MNKDREVSSLVQAWVGPHLPKEHIFVDPDKKPEGVSANVRLYARKWLVHPVRRHLTHFYSNVLSNLGTEIIGVTGSAGKTTTKEMIRQVLSQKYKTVWSPGNIDPIYNIPQTVLHTPLNTEKLVLEMGIEFPGEMDFYLWLAQPKTGVVSTIYWTHTQYLGNLEKVIDQKGKLIESLPKDGFAILNYDDPSVRKLADRTKANVIWYGHSNGQTDSLDVSGSNISISDDFKTRFTLSMEDRQDEINLPILGQHFVSLALAAAAVGMVNNISIKDIKRGLESIKPLEHRMNPTKRKDGTIIVDDTFNANPIAVRESIKLMQMLGKERRKILVLGEMKELGSFEEAGHKEVGVLAAKAGIDIIITLGELTKFTVREAIKNGISRKNALVVDNKDDLIKKLIEFMHPGDLILVKGSRSMKMEEIVEAIK